MANSDIIKELAEILRYLGKAAKEAGWARYNFENCPCRRHSAEASMGDLQHADEHIDEALNHLTRAQARIEAMKLLLEGMKK